MTPDEINQKAEELFKDFRLAVNIEPDEKFIKQIFFERIPLVQLLAVVEAARILPHTAHCHLNSRYPISDKRREEWNKVGCT